MNVLLVEDDEEKRVQLASFAKDVLKSNVVEAKSLNSGVKALSSDDFDLIILDMSMTTFDASPLDKNGGRPQPYGGREILSQMKRRNILTKAVVVTQYDIFGQGDQMTSLRELDEQLTTSFPENYIGSIFYKGLYADWQSLLLDLLKKKKVL